MKKFFHVFMSILICVSMLTSCQNGNKASGNTTEPSTTPPLTTDQPPITTEPSATTEQPEIKTNKQWLESFITFKFSSKENYDNLMNNCGITVQKSYSFDELASMNAVMLNRIVRDESDYISKVRAVRSLASACGYMSLVIKINNCILSRCAEPFSLFNVSSYSDSNGDSYYNICYDRYDFSFCLSFPEELTQEDLDLIKQWDDFCVYFENNKEELQAEQLPIKYIFIRDFEIAKDDFIKLDNLAGHYGYSLSSEFAIELLYCGDTDRIKRAASFDDVFIFDGKLYKVNEIDQEKFEYFMMNSGAFIPYLERCAISSTSSSDDYDRLIKYYIQFMNLTDN